MTRIQRYAHNARPRGTSRWKPNAQQRREQALCRLYVVTGHVPTDAEWDALCEGTR